MHPNLEVRSVRNRDLNCCECGVAVCSVSHVMITGMMTDGSASARHLFVQARWGDNRTRQFEYWQTLGQLLATDDLPDIIPTNVMGVADSDTFNQFRVVAVATKVRQSLNCSSFDVYAKEIVVTNVSDNDEEEEQKNGGDSNPNINRNRINKSTAFHFDVTASSLSPSSNASDISPDALYSNDISSLLWMTDDIPNSYFIFDCRKCLMLVSPYGYILQSPNLRSWKFEGKEDDSQWYFLHKNKSAADDDFVADTNRSFTVTASSDGLYFNHFRLLMTDKNSDGNYQLCLSSFEICVFSFLPLTV